MDYAVPPEIYDAIYDRPSFKDYDAEVRRLREIVAQEVHAAASWLDVACGTGLHLARLGEDFELEGLDRTPAFVARARERVPRARVHEGDMRDFDLGRRFDVVTCLFSAIGYARTRDGLERTCAALARHAAPGGLVLIEPWLAPGAFECGRLDLEVVEHEDLKVARMNTTAREGNLSILEMVHVVGTPQGMHVYRGRHELGLFTTDAMLAACSAAGLEARSEPEGLMGRGLIVARAPRTGPGSPPGGD